MRTRTSLLLTLILAGSAAAPLATQSPRLIGLTRGTTPAVVQLDPARCRVTDRCAPANFRPPLTREAGGTAYDPRTGGVWISNGIDLAKVDPDTCRYQCPPVRAPISANAVVTGLAMQESRHRLFIVDSVGFLTTAVVRNCATVVSRCRINVSLPDGHAFSGLAVDEGRGLILYSASNFTGSSVSQAIYVARTSDPCNPVCATRMTNCSDAQQRLGGITGLAFDPCSSSLIATDGLQVVVAEFAFSPTGCQTRNFRCCGPSVAALGLVGLCIRPAGAVSVGRSCTNGSCGLCPTMVQRIVGDPSIGNPSLRFVLENAPPRSRAFWALNLGTCRPTVQLPPWCAPFLVPLQPFPPIVIGPFGTGGGAAPCDGSASVDLPIPDDPTLCGGNFAVQFLVVCVSPDNRIGTGLSNCLEFELGGT